MVTGMAMGDEIKERGVEVVAIVVVNDQIRRMEDLVEVVAWWLSVKSAMRSRNRKR